LGQVRQARKAYGGARRGPQVVLTHRPADEEEDPTISFITGDVRDAIAAADGKDVVVFGADIARRAPERTTGLEPATFGLGSRRSTS
jgi:hypothetical protein